MAVREITIAYAPRKAFMPFHNRTQRWACLVAHRRAGKTVAAINDIIRAAFMSRDPMPLYGFVAPFRSQAKSVVWEYLKFYSQPIAADSNESELTVTLLNGSKIRLFGADNADAIRGLGFSGIYMDEFGDFKPSVWGNVIRPALSDRQGWAVFGGTPKGKTSSGTLDQPLADLKTNGSCWSFLQAGLDCSLMANLPQLELNFQRISTIRNMKFHLKRAS